MSCVSLLNVKILNNDAPFNAPYQFEITFECVEQLQKDLEWKLIYVGSATSSEHDQELDSLLVGPIPVGVNKFVFEADAPDLTRIPNSEIIGVTVVLLTCSYDGREFVRVGYYVNNMYDDDGLNAEPPATPVIEKVKRSILADKPRVTRFAIKWDSEESAPAEFPPDQPEADAAEDDGALYGAEEEEEEELVEETEAEAVKPADGEDAEMAGADDTAAGVSASEIKEDAEDEEVEVDDAASEDLEAESSGEDDEVYEDEGEGEGEGDADVEMGEEGEKLPDVAAAAGDGPVKQKPEQHHADVMVH